MAGEDAGAGWQRWAWLGAGVVLLPLVVVMQQFSLGLRSQTLSSAPREVVASERVHAPGVSEFTVTSKALVKISHLAEEAPEDEDLAALEQMAVTRVERMRFAIVAGELLGADAARARLEALAGEADPEGDLAAELYWIRKVYEEGPDALSPEAQESLIERHGWFGRLALAFGRGDSDLYRLDVVGGAERLVVAYMSIAAVLVLAGLAGLVFLCVGIAKVRNGSMAAGFVSSPGADVYLETFVVFLGGFLVLIMMGPLMFGIGAEASTGALAFQEVLAWGLAATVFWPLVRGVPKGKFFWQVGLHRGEGVFKEAMCGVAGWMAGLPLSMGVAIGLSFMAAEEVEGSPSGYPLFEPPATESPGLLVLMVLSTVVWAPFVEEMIFRGAIYRFVHAHLRWAAAVLITAALFGLVHPYSTQGLVQVGTAGIVLGLLRQWRGSLIAPMTAHALHNGTIALVTVAIVVALGD